MSSKILLCPICDTKIDIVPSKWHNLFSCKKCGYVGDLDEG